ncbi:MAG: uroporphyrinogen decarboxylase family protein, partial [Candidatus Dormibacteraceae bacterium]
MSEFLKAARKEPVRWTPIWLMRQAGRALPEYRRIRERYRLVEIVAQPELCAEVTLEPVRRFGMDAAVMFADIMLITAGMGISFELVEEVGPVISNPVRGAA